MNPLKRLVLAFYQTSEEELEEEVAYTEGRISERRREREEALERLAAEYNLLTYADEADKEEGE